MLCDHEGEPKCGEYGTVPATQECQEGNKTCEGFAVRYALERVVLPLTTLTDNLGVVHGLDREEVPCTSDKHRHAMDGNASTKRFEKAK